MIARARPRRLLNEAGEATTWRLPASRWRAYSLVVVLPKDPVMATTVGAAACRRRAARSTKARLRRRSMGAVAARARSTTCGTSRAAATAPQVKRPQGEAGGGDSGERHCRDRGQAPQPRRPGQVRRPPPQPQAEGPGQQAGGGGQGGVGPPRRSQGRRRGRQAEAQVQGRGPQPASFEPGHRPGDVVLALADPEPAQRRGRPAASRIQGAATVTEAPRPCRGDGPGSRRPAPLEPGPGRRGPPRGAESAWR